MATVVQIGAEAGAEKLAGWLEGRTYGGTTVVSSTGQVMRDEDGEEAIYLSLTLSDPVGAGWPAAEMMELQRDVVREARPAIICSIYLSIEPETDAPQADDD